MSTGKQNDEQHQEGTLIDATELQRLLERSLPVDEIVHCFAYGSGVFAQQSNMATPNVVDLIVVVRDTYQFHRSNLLQNSAHYAGSPLMWCRDPARCITSFQRHDLEFYQWLQNPKFYFNLCENNLKYGVVQKEDFVEDLRRWKYLYGAGRCHKPVLTVVALDEEITVAQETKNLPGALAAALLLSESETLSCVELYTCIAGLSYAGDPRMQVGAEDPKKVESLVESPGQLQRFLKLYQQSIDQLEGQGIVNRTSDKDEMNHQRIEWDARNPRAREILWKNIPFPIPQTSTLPERLRLTVAAAARYQSMKGLITAGFGKSLAYATRKFSKGLLRR
jgi:translocator assembly and maintenance protein 41